MYNLVWLIIIAVIAFLVWKHFKNNDSALPALRPVSPAKKPAMANPVAPVNPIMSQFSWLGKIF